MLSSQKGKVKNLAQKNLNTHTATGRPKIKALGRERAKSKPNPDEVNSSNDN